MKPYDAKNKQTCKICDFKISHNKQGRFTSHIKNVHKLTLEQIFNKISLSTERLKMFL